MANQPSPPPVSSSAAPSGRLFLRLNVQPGNNRGASAAIQASVSNEDRPLPVSSSTPPNFPPEQRRLFPEVLELMKSRGVPFVVSGAFALHQHTGIWRDTKDLDLFMSAEDATEALRYLRQGGFEVEL